MAFHRKTSFILKVNLKPPYNMLNWLKKLLTPPPEADLVEWLDRGAIILDVRTPEEFRQGTAKGAINIPLDQVGKNMGRIKKYQAPIITCCRSGARSGVAKNQIRAAGIECVNGGPWQTVQEAVIERKNKPNS